jgi:protein-S-isoprenylcysteine O-methyltransferase Ste14
LAWAVFPLPDWSRWFGMSITITSVFLIWWVQWALGVQFDTTLHVREGHQLVSHGPYRWVRHPMYSALFLMGIGWLFLTANWFVGGGLIVGILFIIITRVNKEENLMKETFGDSYADYMQRTGRFLPRIL